MVDYVMVAYIIVVYVIVAPVYLIKGKTSSKLWVSRQKVASFFVALSAFKAMEYPAFWKIGWSDLESPMATVSRSSIL
jgi:hypothetical protein